MEGEETGMGVVDALVRDLNELLDGESEGEET
jgi:hypothetical protein